MAGAAGSGATVTVNGSSSGVFRHGEYFFKGHPLTNTSNPAYTTLAISDGTTSTNMPAFLAKTPEVFGYDDDGNLTLDGRWSYQYDAENRMRWMETAADAVTAGHPKVAYQFFYDYLGRRVRKLDFTWNGSDWTAGTDRRFIYHGWNLVAEHYGPYNGGNFPTNSVRHHVWGADLSGTMQGAGGVGGLLMTTDSGETYLPAYDAMGNVHGMIKGSDGSVAAAYEYDAFGRTIRESGPYAASNPFRFSTKYTDVETELVYFGLRYYSPTLGRFITRDPIGEQGGINLYAFVGNNGVNGYDFLGMDPTVQNVPHNAPDPDRMAEANPDWEYFGDGKWYDPGNDRYVVYVGERGGHQYNAYPDEGLGFTESFGLGTALMDDASNAAFYESLGTEIEEMNERGRAIFGSDGDSVSWSPGGVRGRAADGAYEMNPSVLSVSRSSASRGGIASGLADIGQGIIGVAGLVPIIGNAADLLNATISAARGNYGDAIIDGASAIPGVGQVAGVGGIFIKVGRGSSAIWGSIRRAFGAAKNAATRVPGKASEIVKWAESQGWKRTQTPNGPIKYVDENGVVRATVKQGSSRAPGSGSPHVELRDAAGRRVDPSGNPVTRKSPENHTPIEWDLD